jgi:hypothetical protein
MHIKICSSVSPGSVQKSVVPTELGEAGDSGIQLYVDLDDGWSGGASGVLAAIVVLDEQ